MRRFFHRHGFIILNITEYKTELITVSHSLAGNSQ